MESEKHGRILRGKNGLRFGIRQRLALSFALVIGLLLLLAAGMVWQMRALNVQVERVEGSTIGVAILHTGSMRRSSTGCFKCAR